MLGFLKQSGKLNGKNPTWEILKHGLHDLMMKEKITSFMMKIKFLQSEMGLFRNLKDCTVEEDVILDRAKEKAMQQERDGHIRGWKTQPGQDSYKVRCLKTI